MSTDQQRPLTLPTSHNPTRAAHPVEVQELAVAAVRDLLATATGLSLSSAATTIAESIGAGTSTVMRWCRAAGIGPDEQRAAVERQWQTRLEVVNKLNRDLTEYARNNHRSTPGHQHG